MDFNDCKSYDDVYKVIKDGFNLPHYYGKNPDALWWYLIGYSEKPLVIEITGLIKMMRIDEEHYYFVVDIKEL